MISDWLKCHPKDWLWHSLCKRVGSVPSMCHGDMVGFCMLDFIGCPYRAGLSYSCYNCCCGLWTPSICLLVTWLFCRTSCIIDRKKLCKNINKQTIAREGDKGNAATSWTTQYFIWICGIRWSRDQKLRHIRGSKESSEQLSHFKASPPLWQGHQWLYRKEGVTGDWPCPGYRRTTVLPLQE